MESVYEPEEEDAVEIQVSGVCIECVRGDITDQPDFDVVVNAANAQLRTGGGVAGAIHRAAGRGLAEECRPLAPISPGEAVITGGHDLPNPHVIHALGPVYGEDEPAAELQHVRRIRFFLFGQDALDAHEEALRAHG